jgi:16S rRNA (guanine527-N7)-methyltransferase
VATPRETLIERTIAAAGQSAAPGSAARLAAYLDLLNRWNRAYNLSAVRDPEAMVARHVADSLSLRPWLPEGGLLDVGTGAGLPGLVVAITEPQRPLTLLDSGAKKIRFLQQVVIELGLDNVTVVQARAEGWQAEAPLAAVTSRAFASLATFWHVAAPLLAGGGEALAMKGQYPSQELAALPDEGLSCSVERLTVPGLQGERHLVRLSRAMS